MIKATELRIGNMVLVIDLAPITITADHIKSIYEWDTDYSPIPLTPEILEKCGFEEGCLVKNLNDEWMIYFNDMMWLQVEKMDGYIVCERMGLEHIKYLHQLQNLYFALTGTELEIKF